eukprot:354166-Rhodomonas_salina.1
MSLHSFEPGRLTSGTRKDVLRTRTGSCFKPHQQLKASKEQASTPALTPTGNEQNKKMRKVAVPC